MQSSSLGISIVNRKLKVGTCAKRSEKIPERAMNGVRKEIPKEETYNKYVGGAGELKLEL